MHGCTCAAARPAGAHLPSGCAQIDVLNGASADIRPGEAVALVGPSGAGKSTLLHIAGLLETPDGGHVIINGRTAPAWAMRPHARAPRADGLRLSVPPSAAGFSALENIVVPQLILGRTKPASRASGRALLGPLGLGERVDHRPAELSGGEQQRTAIARALTNAAPPPRRRADRQP